MIAFDGQKLYRKKNMEMEIITDLFIII